MADRSLKVKLEATVDGFVAGIRKAEAATKDFAKNSTKGIDLTSKQWQAGGKALLGAGTVMGAGILYATKQFADFDQQMSAVSAALDGSPAQMKAVTAAVREAGKASVFTSVEAGQAAEELAKAGISASDIVGGALTGSMNLAAAGAIGLADAAQISGQAMKIFGLRGKDVGHIADVLTAGANKSAAGVDDLGQALRQGGLVAAQTGLSLEETVGTLSAFADNALMGSDAGTSLKTMLQRLNPQSKQAADLMKKLGFSAYDAQGNFIGMDKLAGELQTSLAGMSSEQRNAALQTLFGSDAVRGANVLYKLGADGIRKYVKQVNDQGIASRTAAKRLDNLKGDVEKLQGALSDLFIGAGSSGNSFFRGLTQNATKVVDAFGSMPEPLQKAAFFLGAATTAVSLLGGAAILAVPKVIAFKVALEAMGISAGKQKGVLKGLGKAISVLAVADAAVQIDTWIRNSDNATVSIDNLANALTRMDKAGQGIATGALADLFRDNTGIFRSDEKIVTTAEALDRFSVSAYNALGGSLDAKLGRWTSFGDDMGQFRNQVTQLDKAMAQMVKSGNVEQASNAYAQFTAAAEAQGVEVSKLAPFFKQYMKALGQSEGGQKQAAEVTGELVDAQKQNAVAQQNAGRATEDAGRKSKAAAPSLRLFGQDISDAGDKAKGAKIDVDKFADAIRGLNEPYLDARAASRDFQQAIDDVTAGLKENGRTLNQNTDAGRKNAANLDNVASSGKRLVASLVERGASEKQVRKAIDDSNAALRRAGKALGLTGKDLDNYVKHAGFSKDATQAVIDKMRTLAAQHPRPDMKVLGDKAAREAIAGVQARLEKLDRSHASPSVRVVGVASAMSDLGSIIGRMDVLDGKHATSSVTTTRTYRTNYVSTGSPGGNFGFRKADGGPIYGPGTSRSDSILGVDKFSGMATARVSVGEFVTNAQRYQQYRPLVEAINSGTKDQIRAYASRLTGLAGGGQVRFSSQRATPAASPVSTAIEAPRAGLQQTNYIAQASDPNRTADLIAARVMRGVRG